MSHTLMLVPVSDHVGLNTVALGLIETISELGMQVNYFKPINQNYNEKEDDDLNIARKFFNFSIPDAISVARVESFLSRGAINELLEEIVAFYQLDEMLEDITTRYQEERKNADIVIVQGLTYREFQPPYITYLNIAIARALDAKIIFIASPNEKKPTVLKDQIEIMARFYDASRVLGCIINRIKTSDLTKHKAAEKKCQLFSDGFVSILGCIPQKDHFSKTRDSIKKNIVEYIDREWVITLMKEPYIRRITPQIFFYQLVEKARRFNKRIALPEGKDLRTIQAAIMCANRNIARCILFGNRKEIEKIASEHRLELNEKIEVIEPQKLVEQYVAPMAALRKHKGLTEEAARKALQEDPMTLATMMLYTGDVDGIVSGATHTTAETVRPAFQLIKTPPEVRLVSSLFFMCLPNEVLVYADCAVNQNPGAEDLADIAIQSARTAAKFGILPCVAMISFSTGSSAEGPDVEKVQAAVRFAQQKCPDLLVDGPMQYDAATDPEVGKRKAPNSPVAGKANIFIFPDLDAGNTVYKAVQRTNNILCVGPVLQGLRKPVNDLSRGCSAEDIVYTIAITAIQAG